MSKVNSKVIIVTGAMGGIGKVTARLLAEAGANVVLSDVSKEGGIALAEELSATGNKATYFAANIAVENDVRGLVDHAVSTFGKLDGAFNNAGISEAHKPLVELTEGEWDRVMDINAKGTFFCIKHQFLAMTAGGSIVNNASGLGVIALPLVAEYCASKHAVCGLTRAAAVEGAANGIRVNAILPGAVRTDMQKRLFGDDLDAPEVQEMIRKIHLIPRYCEPEEVGYLARWLLSDEAAFVTGSLYNVDGGLTAV